MSIIIDASTPLTLSSSQNLALLNKISSNTQRFINSNMLSNALLPYATSNYVITAIATTSDNLQTNINLALALKQDILTFTSPLNKSVNTVSIDLSSYTNTTGMNTAISTVSNTLQANINTKLTIPTASTTLVGIGSNLTFLDYLNIKNPPILNYLQLSGGSITGNITTEQLYINNPNSTASIFFNPTASIYALFSKKTPWAMYFAEDYNTTTKILPNYISNGRDAVCSGTIAKTTLAGNGATGPITYISGGTAATIAFPTGSIPQVFTILSLTRYKCRTRFNIM